MIPLIYDETAIGNKTDKKYACVILTNYHEHNFYCVCQII